MTGKKAVGTVGSTQRHNNCIDKYKKYTTNFSGVKQMEWLRRLKLNMRAKKNYAKRVEKFSKNENQMPWHIYSNGQPESFSDHVKHFTWIHYVVKGYFITPAIWLAKAVFGKHIQKKIPPYWYNNTLIIFNKAFDDALFDWYKHFILNLNEAQHGKPFPPDEEIRKMSEAHTSSKELRILRDMFLTGIQNDTAYREFFNILMFNITIGIQKEYGEKGSIQHPLYVSKNIMDKNYFLVGKIVNRFDVNAKVVQATVRKPGEPKND